MSIAKQLVSHYRGKGQFVDAYGVILFTDAHPHIAKVLQDRTYWRAFDEISGSRWAIFSAKPKRGCTRMPKIRAGIAGLMIPVWEEPNENKPLIREFELESTEDLPLLLVFAWDQDSHQIVKVTIALDDSTIEGAYNSLRTSIRRVTGVFEGTLIENRWNARELVTLVADEQSCVKRVEALKKAVSLAKWALETFKL